MNTVPRGWPFADQRHPEISALGRLSVETRNRSSAAPAMVAQSSRKGIPLRIVVTGSTTAPPFIASNVKIHAKLKRMRPHADGIDLVLLLVLDPVMNHVRGEDV